MLQLIGRVVDDGDVQLAELHDEVGDRGGAELGCLADRDAVLFVQPGGSNDAKAIGEVLEIFWRQGDTRVLEGDAHVEAGAIRVRDHVRPYQAGMASAVRALQAAMLAPMAGPTESVASVSAHEFSKPSAHHRVAATARRGAAILARAVRFVLGGFSLLSMAVGATGAAVLSVVPTIAWVLAVPLLVCIELGLFFGGWRRFARSFVSRVAAGTAVLAIAWALPTKPDDTIIVGPLPTTPVTIAELNDVFARHPTVPLIGGKDVSGLRVAGFSSDHVTLRRFLDELGTQTHRRAHMGRCGNGATLLFGASPMGGVWLE